jgi:transposase-like protein
MRKSYTAAFKARIVQEVLKGEKTVAQLAAEYQLHPIRMYRWRDIALAGLPSLFTDQTTQAHAAQAAAHEREVQDSTRRLASSRRNSTGSKKVAVLSWAERLSVLDMPDPELSIRTQTALLGLNRTNRCYQPVAPSVDEVALKHQIDAIYTR